ncbi:MAG: TrmO family methyltransferase [Polyangia bacterium]
MSIDRLTATSIGIIHSPFLRQEGTPIQPYSAKGVEGSVEVYPPYAEGLADLEGFERIWLVYWFDRACAPKLRVLPYRDTREHGVFATRGPSPHQSHWLLARAPAWRGRHDLARGRDRHP